MLEPSELATLPALAITRDASPWELTGRDRKTALVRPRVGFAANRQTILVDAAIANLGIANLPTFLVQDALLTGRLGRIDIQDSQSG
ncbi:LysR substrate-binding domain-containing protein [Aureimonas sp. Leaf460]|uniref:LysR substrate-binding domain-containing protein n=1 Tax=unclassified Aureimonas TaxID=2615206 RepID=UPI0026CEDF26